MRQSAEAYRFTRLSDQRASLTHAMQVHVVWSVARKNALPGDGRTSKAELEARLLTARINAKPCRAEPSQADAEASSHPTRAAFSRLSESSSRVSLAFSIYLAFAAQIKQTNLKEMLAAAFIGM